MAHSKSAAEDVPPRLKAFHHKLKEVKCANESDHGTASSDPDGTAGTVIDPDDGAGSDPDCDIPDQPTGSPNGPNDHLILKYSLTWFPNLLVYTYYVVEKFLKDAEEFKEFFSPKKLAYC